MSFTTVVRDDAGRFLPWNELGKVDWICPECGHRHVDTQGNYPCTESPRCQCSRLDDMMRRGARLEQLSKEREKKIREQSPELFKLRVAAEGGGDEGPGHWWLWFHR